MTSSVTSTQLGIATAALFVAGGLSLIAIPSRSLNPVRVAPKPDFEPTQITMESHVTPEGAGWHTQAVIKNNGIGAAGRFESSFYREKTDKTLVLLSTSFQQSLAANGEKNVSDSAIFADPTIAVLLKVDPANQVSETNEDNNMLWLGTSSAMRSGQQLDVAVRNLQVTRLNAREKEITFDVVNYGEVDVGNVDLNLTIVPSAAQRAVHAPYLNSHLDSLKAGKQKTIRFTVPSSEALLDLQASVDANHTLQDIDWSNNTIGLAR